MSVTDYYQDCYNNIMTPEFLLTLKQHGFERRRRGFGSSHTVVVYPPFANSEPFNKSHEEIVEDFEGEEVDVYVHVPLCEYPCVFCHYPKKTIATDSIPKSDLYFIELILQEAEYWKKLFKGSLKMRTLYIGGGTAFILDCASIRRLVEGITRIIPPVPKDFHFCIESSVGTLIRKDANEKLRLLKEFGLNRISVGVQTFSENILRSLGRFHKPAASAKCIHDALNEVMYSARDVVPEINIDLMQDMEGYNDVILGEDLQWLIGSQATSVTLYIERLHPGSSGYYHNSRFLDSSPDFTRKSVSLRVAAIRFLQEHGFTMMPAGRFSKSRFIDVFKESRGTQKATLLGLGNGANSRLGVHFFRSAKDLKEWATRIKKQGMGAAEYHCVSKSEIIEGELISNMRNSIALESLEDLLSKHQQKKYQAQIRKCISDLDACNLIERNGHNMRLTILGRAFEEEICWRLYSEDNRRISEMVYIANKENGIRNNI